MSRSCVSVPPSSSSSIPPNKVQRKPRPILPQHQVVLCGAGMDARAYRLPELKGRKVFELDVKPVLEYKAGVLAEVG